MSDVIEAMVDGYLDCMSLDPTEIMTAALRAAEQAGWRLVPVEPTTDMLDCLTRVPKAVVGGKFPYVSKYRLTPTWRDLLQAAPRPWAEPDEVKG